MGGRSRYWIQKAVPPGRRGVLTRWILRNRGLLARRLGYDPLTIRDGRLNIKEKAKTDLIRLVKTGGLKVRDKSALLKRLYLAKTLSRLRRRR